MTLAKVTSPIAESVIEKQQREAKRDHRDLTFQLFREMMEEKGQRTLGLTIHKICSEMPWESELSRDMSLLLGGLVWKLLDTAQEIENFEKEMGE